MFVLVWVFLLAGIVCLILSSAKVVAQRVDLQSLGLLCWLAAVVCMRVG